MTLGGLLGFIEYEEHIFLRKEVLPFGGEREESRGDETLHDFRFATANYFKKSDKNVRAFKSNMGRPGLKKDPSPSSN